MCTIVNPSGYVHFVTNITKSGGKTTYEIYVDNR